MEPKTKFRTGFIAVALGLAAFSPVNPFAFLGNTAAAQQPNAPAAATNPLLDPYYISAQKLHFARKAVATQDIATAERLTAEVETMRLQYREKDEQPVAVRHLIQQFKNIADYARTTGNTEQVRRNFAVFFLQQADVMVRRGELDLAAQLAQEAAKQGVTFSQADVQAGFEPQTMFKRIDDARRVRNMYVAAAQPTMQVAAPQPQVPLSQTAQNHLTQAMSILFQGRQALNAGQLDRAEQMGRVAMDYRLAESLYPPESDTPSRLLAEVAARRQNLPMPYVQHQPQPRPENTNSNIRQVGLGNAPMIDQHLQQRQALVARVSSDVMQQISEAQRICREQRKPDDALDILNNVKGRVQQSQLDAATKDAFVRNIDRVIAETVSYSEKHQPLTDLEMSNQAVLDARRREAKEFKNKEERLKTFITECNKLLDEQRYEEAAILAKKARDFAPDEPATHMLLTTTQLTWNLSRSKAIVSDKENAFVNAMLDADRGAIMPDFGKSPVHYADNWRELTSRRRSSDEVLKSRRPESELEILRKLEAPVSINLDRPISLEELLKILSGQTGVDIIVDWAALRDVDVTSDRAVSIQIMKEIKLKSVLNLVLGQMNLSYVVKDEMLNITSAAKAKGELYSRTYYVGDLTMEIPQISRQNPNDMNTALERAQRTANLNPGRSIHGPLSMNGQTPLGNMPNTQFASTSNPGMLAQTFAPSGGAVNAGSGNSMPLGNGYGPVKQGAAGGGTADFGPIIDLIQSIVSPDSWEDKGGAGTMMEYMANMSLIVRQTEEVHAELTDLLTQLRKLNDLQIAVEVRFITLSDDFFEMMGVDFDAVFKNSGAAGKVITATTGGTNNNNANNSNNNNSSDSSDSSTIIGGNNVTVGLAGPGSFMADLSIPFKQNSFALSNQPMFGVPNPDLGMSFGFALLSEIEAYFFMNAAQGDSRSNVLQAPKVMIFNGQMGTIQDMAQTPFVTSVTPVVGDFAAGYQPIITVLNEGQITTVQGTVSNNRQYVRLTVNPTFTKITKTDTWKVVGEESSTDETETSAKGDASTVASTNERASKTRKNKSSSGVTIQLPTLANFSVQTTVSVPDGGTILLGGIKRLREGRAEGGVPILNKIPYVQRLFQNTSIGRETQSIMMMVTPRIIIQEEEEEYLLGTSSNP